MLQVTMAAIYSQVSHLKKVKDSGSRSVQNPDLPLQSQVKIEAKEVKFFEAPRVFNLDSIAD